MPALMIGTANSLAMIFLNIFIIIYTINMRWFVLSLVTVLSELVLFIEISRHGARSPMKFVDWDQDGR